MQGGSLLMAKVLGGGEVTLRAKDNQVATTHLADLSYDIDITIKHNSNNTVTITGEVKAEAPTERPDVGHTYSFLPYEMKYSMVDGNLQIPVIMYNVIESADDGEEDVEQDIVSQFNGTLTIKPTSKRTGTFEFQPPGGSGTVARNLKIISQ